MFLGDEFAEELETIGLVIRRRNWLVHGRIHEGEIALSPADLGGPCCRSPPVQVIKGRGDEPYSGQPGIVDGHARPTSVSNAALTG